jgi:hypothetical protein
MRNTTDYRKLTERAAERIYKTRKSEVRGEIGELLLHAICRQFSGTFPAVSKIYYKDSSNKDELEHREIIERGFRALGAFDYSVPTLLLDMEALVNYHCALRGLDEVDYSLMAQKLDNVFCHHWVKALDEYGVPLPLGKKLEFLIRETFALDDAIDSVRQYCRSRSGRDRLTPFEISLIEAALS